MNQGEKLSWVWQDVFPFAMKDPGVNEFISGILTMNTDYRHEVLPDDPAVQVLTGWEDLYKDRPEILTKVMNLSVVVSKGRRALRVNQIHGQHASFTVALDFHEESEIKSRGIYKNPEESTLYTLKGASKYIHEETDNLNTIQEQGSLLKDWELERILFISMPEYYFDDFRSIFNPTPVRYWNHDEKQFSEPTYTFWTDIDVYESWCMAIAWHEVSWKAFPLSVVSDKDTTRLNKYPILLVLERWWLPETEAEYQTKYIRS